MKWPEMRPKVIFGHPTKFKKSKVAYRSEMARNAISVNIYIYIQTAMLGTREYTLCSPFRANAHNSSLLI